MAQANDTKTRTEPTGKSPESGTASPTDNTDPAASSEPTAEAVPDPGADEGTDIDVDLDDATKLDETYVEEQTEAAGQSSDAITFQQCVALLQSRPRPDIADLPATQVSNAIHRLSQGEPFVMSDAFLLGTSAEMQRSGGRAHPAKQPLIHSQDDGWVLMADTDAVLADGTATRLPKGSAIAVTHLEFKGEHAASIPLELSVAPNAQSAVVTKDCHTGTAAFVDGRYILKEGSGERSREQVSSGDCHEAVLKGKSIRVAVLDGDVRLTYDLMRPFSCELLARLPAGVTYRTVERTLNGMGRTLVKVSGPLEADKLRELLARPAPATDEQPMQLLKGSSDIQPPLEILPAKELDSKDIGRLKALSEHQSTGDIEPFTAPMDGAKMKRRNAMLNAKDAVHALNVTLNDQLPDLVAADIRAKTISGGGDNLGALDAEALDVIEEGLVDEYGDLALADDNEPQSTKAVLGAAGMLNAMLDRMMRASGLVPQDDNVIVQEVLQDYMNRVGPADVTKAIGSLKSKGVSDADAQVVARDSLASASIRAKESQVLMEISALLVVSFVAKSLQDGKPSVLNLRKDHMFVFAMTLDRGAARSLSRYVSSIVDELLDNGRPNQRKSYDMVDALIMSAATKRLPPDANKRLNALQSDWKRVAEDNLVLYDSWPDFLPQVTVTERRAYHRSHLKLYGAASLRDPLAAREGNKWTLALDLQKIPLREHSVKANVIRGDSRNIAKIARAGPFVMSFFDKQDTRLALAVLSGVVPSFLAFMKANILNRHHKAFARNLASAKDSSELMSAMVHVREAVRADSNFKGLKLRRDGDHMARLAQFLRDLHAFDKGIQIMTTFDAYAKAALHRSNARDMDQVIEQEKLAARAARKQATAALSSEVRGMYSEFVDAGIDVFADLLPEGQEPEEKYDVGRQDSDADE